MTGLGDKKKKNTVTAQKLKLNSPKLNKQTNKQSKKTETAKSGEQPCFTQQQKQHWHICCCTLKTLANTAKNLQPSYISLEAHGAKNKPFEASKSTQEVPLLQQSLFLRADSNQFQAHEPREVHKFFY